MLNKLLRPLSFPVKIARLLKRNENEKRVFRRFEEASGKGAVNDRIVLLQCVEDIYYWGLFGVIISALREKTDIRVEHYVLNSFRIGEFNSPYHFVRSRVENFLLGVKWIALYQSFCDATGYKSTGLALLPSDLLDMPRAYRIWRGIETREQLTKLVVDGILIGDLVNDSFLRFRPAPTVDLKAWFLWRVIWQALRDLRRASNYFDNVSPALYLTSYSTYVQHGIAVRTALMKGIRVISFGSFQQLSKWLTDADSYHSNYTEAYKSDFGLLEDGEACLQMAEAALAKRLSGGIDHATGYMKTSAYAETTQAVPEVEGKVVVFLHDFFDSPHVYRNLVFPDFWQWITFTIEALSNHGLPFVIKPHPNQIGQSAEVTEKLKQRYPDVSFIPTDITNNQLVQGGVACAVTVYGTVAHEMAYLGVPTVACARHPHISFDFCRTAANRDEYRRYLEESVSFQTDPEQLKRESLMFYYMHNLNYDPMQKKLNDSVTEYRLKCLDPEVSAEALIDGLEKIAGLEGFDRFIGELKDNIEPVVIDESQVK